MGFKNFIGKIDSNDCYLNMSYYNLKGNFLFYISMEELKVNNSFKFEDKGKNNVLLYLE